MNLFSYFSHKNHHSFFKANHRPLVFSGVGNSSAKSFLVSDYVHFKSIRNVFWLASTDKELYEIKNNISFWMDHPVLVLDHLAEQDQQSDYRITETVIGFNDKTTRIYLLKSKDVALKIPS
ncbi:hypothetical protein IPJ72_00020 [Candidatus Peregrinibacteria bacterium]|nr:MAG: hypothetical protein IPJ72_00020 [Candidatus Peregrinibacteria bacterium]